ncbi:MAG TPA: hypothetical protein VLY24_24285 [Bryobacteraceae bacterium]|nr:hypothetical protein [Bryobacteraceae bacterium]
MPSALRIEGRTAPEIRAVIESFLKNCREPALLEPGEDILPLGKDNFSLEVHGSRLILEAWDRARNFSRRLTAIKGASASRLELVVEHFGKRQGQMFLLDLSRRAGAELGRRSGRLVFRERFRLFLRRQFPEWKLAELSAEANLEFSLSPVYPRAYLRHGQHGWAAIACPSDADSGAVLTFGLIWLSYLRARERRVAIEGLVVYVPQGHEQATALRLHCLDDGAARFALFAYSPEDFLAAIDPHDRGNLDTRLEPCRRPAPNHSEAWTNVASLPGVERVSKHDGRASLRIRGLEFAELSGDGALAFGLEDRQPARSHHASEIERLVEELASARSHDTTDRDHPLYRRYPEAWLESQVRRHIETVDAALLPEPIYDQVPAFAGGERGVLDLLAVDRTGRLAVVELKATADLHLPLQALDYWVRVQWHLDRGEFSERGYFPGLELQPEPPRLLLVSPSLEFHPTTEAILSYFSPSIEVVRVGLGMDWRKELQVMFRLAGAQKPQSG